MFENSNFIWSLYEFWYNLIVSILWSTRNQSFWCCIIQDVFSEIRENGLHQQRSIVHIIQPQVRKLSKGLSWTLEHSLERLSYVLSKQGQRSMKTAIKRFDLVLNVKHSKILIFKATFLRQKLAESLCFFFIKGYKNGRLTVIIIIFW